MQEVLIIDPDKPREPKRHFTNAGVNIRLIHDITVVVKKSCSICVN